MKATLEFNLPEEECEHNDAINGQTWHCIVQSIDEHCRSWLKHGHSFKTADEAIQAVRDIISRESPELY